MTNPNWTKTNPDVIRFVFEQAAKYLSTQLTTGIAADQRATSAAATFSGFAGAILAATIGYYSAKLDVGILLAGLVTGLAFVIAAGCSFYSARPVDFSYPGNDPTNWYSSLSNPLSESMGVEAENYSAAIADNEAILNKNAKWLMAAFWAAAIAPIAGVAVFLIANLSCPA